MGNKLIAYFSVTGTTADVAVRMAKAAKLDLYEIMPQVAYVVPEDLNWSDKTSRTTLEMTNLDSRPAIEDRDAHIEKYDTVFLGFPIQWWIAPTIINTFLDRYDFAGKKIVLFATSGGSGFGNALENLKRSAHDANFVEGRVFKSDVSDEELKAWTEKY